MDRKQFKIDTVAVHGDARDAIVGEFVVHNDIAGYQSHSSSIGEYADACARPRQLIPVVGGYVTEDRVIDDAKMRG